ncbi:MAG TPA: class I SAM-dependent methyltransferase [Nannocystis sp.]
MQPWRHSPRDAAVVAPPLALALLAPILPWLAGHGLGGMSLATAAIALTVWWLSNTVAHIHLHTPVFRRRTYNRLFSLLLSLLTGVPQAIWRHRHLAHHRDQAPGPLRPGRYGSLEIAAVAQLWLALAVTLPAFFLATYLPGFLLGLGLCQLQGRGEHLAGPGGISHDAALHNRLWFNDGYHAEHHRWPGAHWTTLPARRLADAPRSRFPPVLRNFLVTRPSIPCLLGALERLALACPPLQRALVRVHARAIARLMPALARTLAVPGDLSRRPARIAVVGGGLFPRTALALARVWPAAQVTLLDADAGHLDRARRLLAAHGHAPELLHATWDPHAASTHDLVIVPLALVGDREAVYAAPGPPRLVHDWSWRRRGHGVVVAWWLLKRLNLVDGTDTRRA